MSKLNREVFFVKRAFWPDEEIQFAPIDNCTSIKIIKNEVGCRDDTVPKTVGTRRHCEEE